MDPKKGSLEVGEGGGVLQARGEQSHRRGREGWDPVLLFSQEIEAVVDLEKSSSVW